MEFDTKIKDEKQKRQVEVDARILPQGEVYEVRLDKKATLLELLEATIARAGETLIYSNEQPLDTLHNLDRKGVSPAIEMLDEPVDDYLRKPHTSKDFGVKLVRAIKVNREWRVAPMETMTPTEILGLFNLDASYGLYQPNQPNALSPDTPIPVTRGLVFEAQRSGAYGGGTTPLSLFQTELEALQKEGVHAEQFDLNGQSYVVARGVDVPAPPWNQTTYDILVAVPSAYDLGAALDAFYLAMPYSFRGGMHPRVGNAGQQLTWEGRTWLLVSWHYADGTAWRSGRDTLSSHLNHCRLFFWQQEVM